MKVFVYFNNNLVFFTLSRNKSIPELLFILLKSSDILLSWVIRFPLPTSPRFIFILQEFNTRENERMIIRFKVFMFIGFGCLLFLIEICFNFCFPVSFGFSWI